MKMKVDDVLLYKDSHVCVRYGTGVVTAITPDEYTILWSGRGLTRYKRSILDEKLDKVFERVDTRPALPKERYLQLGPAKIRVAFNENYDRAKVERLCEKLKSSGARRTKDVAEGLAAELFTKKLALRGAAKAVLLQLAELCGSRGTVSSDAQSISRELFFGYVLQSTDFQELKREK